MLQEANIGVFIGILSIMVILTGVNLANSAKIHFIAKVITWETLPNLCEKWIYNIYMMLPIKLI